MTTNDSRATSDSRAAESLRSQLRSGTREAHQRLDEVVGSLKPFTTDDGYAAYLSGMYGIYETFGDAMDQASEESGLPKISGTLRQCITDDLGSVPSDSPHSAKPKTTAEIWAAAYVLEGASMGARHIVKQLSAGQTDRRISFLTRLAEGSSERWPKFIAALDQSSRGSSQENSVDQTAATVEAAKKVFEEAHQIFRHAATKIA